MKKGIKVISAAFSIAVLLSSCYIQKETEQVKTITVTGTGTVSDAPDAASVEFSIVNYGWSAKLIVTDNDTLTNRLKDAVKNAGVNEEDITITECSITNPTSQYEARRTLKAVTTNVKLVPAIVDCKSGAFVRLGKTEYFVSDSANTIRRARTAAVQNAQDAASLLAGASGCKIGAVVEINNEEITTSTTSDGKIVTSATIKITYNLE